MGQTFHFIELNTKYFFISIVLKSKGALSLPKKAQFIQSGREISAILLSRIYSMGSKLDSFPRKGVSFSVLFTS